jgi:LuxR family maltose regulon positive regulatory protein
MPGGGLLATKLYMPPARPSGHTVVRSRLFGQLAEGLDGRLTLLSAPAGYGKTTLLGEWLSTYPCPAAWISLDAGDNDPVCFISYLAAALSTIVPAVGEAVGEVLRVSGALPVEPTLTVLINATAAGEAIGDPPISS